MKKALAIITARSGSKGLPKPLIWYTIKAAKESGMYDEIMVSTDSQKYADIAIECGASVPFLRSEATSTDTATSMAVVCEVIEMYKELGKEFDTVTILQPTSPLREASDIVGGFRLKEEKKASVVVSVCDMEHPINIHGPIGDDLSFDNFFDRDNQQYIRRQDAAKYYRINGALYIIDVDVALSGRFLYSENCYAYIMDIKKSVDVDTIDDFEYVEFLMNKQK